METKVEELRIEPKYEIDIFWSVEDDAFIAVVPDLPYCSAWGETYEAALNEARVAIRGHLKVAEKYGDPIPEPKHRQEARESEASIVSQQQAPSQSTEELTGRVRQTFQTLADRTVSLQESNLRFVQALFQDFVQQLQTQGTSEATQNLREKGHWQREAFETLLQEATNAYSQFLDSALSFYEETLNIASQVVQSNVQTASQAVQAGTQAASQATQQSIQTADQSAREGAGAAKETTESANLASKSS